MTATNIPDAEAKVFEGDLDRVSIGQATFDNAQDVIQLPVGFETLDPSFNIYEFLQSNRINASPSSITEQPLNFQSPFTWTIKKKIRILSGAFMASTLASYSAGAYAMASEPLRNKWNIGDTQFNAGITLFVTGFAIAPMVLAPVSEVHGRYWVFVGSGIIFFLGSLGCAVTESFAGMMVARLITGNGAAVFATLTGGVVSDLYRKEDRNTPMALYSLSIMIGTGLGPLVSGAIVDRLGWRWIFYLQLITIGTATAIIFFLFQETRSNVLLRKKCLALNAMQIKTSHGLSVSFSPSAQENLHVEISMIWRSLAFPLRLLVTESILFWFSVWVSFAWAILYMQFSSIGIVFREVYGFDSTQVGAVYAAVVVGSILSIVMAVIQEPLTRLVFPHKIFSTTPEQRLLSPCIQSILLPIGLFWFFISARSDVTWVSPTLAIGSCTMGIYSIYLAVFNYLADTYHGYASSALAAQSLCRNLLGGVFPLLTARMISSLTLKGTGGLLGGLGLVLTAIPWLLYFCGKGIRARSPFAKEME
ncbi:drug proton antiporter yhk8 [Fusarium longipes]|uniref:Drug proton antiporter yhk8 n=1 Tax=Fusarium longipes TaxID=694270 RepID=A0A395SZW2_9HYPO|nr:drug proton antiporter yhk8 [Fusarium longipes]